MRPEIKNKISLVGDKGGLYARFIYFYPQSLVSNIRLSIGSLKMSDTAQ